MVTDEYENLREAYRRKPEQEAPAPWRRISVDINGVTAVGFGPGTDLLLVMSHSGLGVVECSSGRVVARDHEEATPEDPYPVWATGIGPLAGQRIPLAGLWGGGLRSSAPDGWVVHRASPMWPTECAVLSPPDSPELDDDTKTTILLKDLDPEIRALGFSDSGKTLVVANTQLFLWSRP